MLEANSIEGQAPKNKTIGKNVSLSVLCIVFVFIIYAGVFGWKFSLNKKLNAVEAGGNEKYSAFVKGNASAVIDFQKRSKLAEKLLSETKSNVEIFEKIEKSLLPQAYLISYEYKESDKSIKLECVADNYNTVAKQVLSFKQSGDFESVACPESKYDSVENKLIFNVNLTLK